MICKHSYGPGRGLPISSEVKVAVAVAPIGSVRSPTREAETWAAQGAGCEKQVLMPIRITCHDKCSDRRKLVEMIDFIMPSKESREASYTDRNEDSRILCGSI
jgi:hypothetical protein